MILTITAITLFLSTGALGFVIWFNRDLPKQIKEQKEQIQKLNESLKNTYDQFVKSNNLLRQENERSTQLEQTATDLKGTIESKDEEILGLHNSFEERVKTEVELESEKIRSEVEKDFNDALQEQIEEFGNKVSDIDKMLQERVADIQAKNTLYFSCSCDKDRKIPVSLDFTTENRFSCDKCGSVYRVELNAYPVLLSNVSNNKVIANIFKEGQTK